MSCACESRRMGRQEERVRRLAKAWAKMEGVTAVLYRDDDGTYGFTSVPESTGKNIVEYITPY